jgi:hypothetical protein
MIHVVELISFKLSKKPLELELEEVEAVDIDGKDGSLDCNIALDNLLVLSIIIKINILIFIINSHLHICTSI